MTEKSFIITVDTEGDNLWRYRDGDPICTENARFIGRFQSQCDQFGFKPVYLTNYEMACNRGFVEEAREWLSNDRCEIGIHLHAWNNPPIHHLEGPHSGQPYLIEYPEEVMRDKFGVVYNKLQSEFGVRPISHRAGRWAMDDRYFRILNEFGVKVDCSVTPLISWAASPGITRGGSDYSAASMQPSMIDGILEVPMTVRRNRVPVEGSVRHRLRTAILGENLWMRPAVHSLAAMKHLADIVGREPQTDYIEFMIHSSELMPGGSPYNPSDASVEKFYDRMKGIFEYVAKSGYVGNTLADYYHTKCEK